MSGSRAADWHSRPANTGSAADTTRTPAPSRPRAGSAEKSCGVSSWGNFSTSHLPKASPRLPSRRAAPIKSGIRRRLPKCATRRIAFGAPVPYRFLTAPSPMTTLAQEPPQKLAAPDLEIKDAQLIFNGVWKESRAGLWPRKPPLPKGTDPPRRRARRGQGHQHQFHPRAARHHRRRPSSSAPFSTAPRRARSRPAAAWSCDRDVVGILLRKLLEARAAKRRHHRRLPPHQGPGRMPQAALR